MISAQLLKNQMIHQPYFKHFFTKYEHLFMNLGKNEKISLRFGFVKNN